MATKKRPIEAYIADIVRKIEAFPGVNTTVTKGRPYDAHALQQEAYFIYVSPVEETDDWLDALETVAELETDALLDTGYSVYVLHRDAANLDSGAAVSPIRSS